MAKKEYTSYQKGVISGYYNNLDAIMLTKLQELVTELYLADSAVKQKRLWDRVPKAMLLQKAKSTKYYSAAQAHAEFLPHLTLSFSSPSILI